jgi:hypothetical protein
MRHRRLRPLVVACATAAGACTGPTLQIENPDRHLAFRDGVTAPGKPMPFRYFGVTTIDAQPADDHRGRADWSRTPKRQTVAIPPPAPGWLFPLDLPIALVDRLLHGRGDRTVQAEVGTTPIIGATGNDAADAELAAIAARAQAARVTR